MSGMSMTEVVESLSDVLSDLSVDEDVSEDWEEEEEEEEEDEEEGDNLDLDRRSALQRSLIRSSVAVFITRRLFERIAGQRESLNPIYTPHDHQYIDTMTLQAFWRMWFPVLESGGATLEEIHAAINEHVERDNHETAVATPDPLTPVGQSDADHGMEDITMPPLDTTDPNFGSLLLEWWVEHVDDLYLDFEANLEIEDGQPGQDHARSNAQSLLSRFRSNHTYSSYSVLAVKDYLMGREIGSGAACTSRCRDSLVNPADVLLSLEDVEYPAVYAQQPGIDKIFAAEWLQGHGIGGDSILFGTKCNRLFAYDVSARKVVPIALPPSRSTLTSRSPEGGVSSSVLYDIPFSSSQSHVVDSGIGVGVPGVSVPVLAMAMGEQTQPQPQPRASAGVRSPRRLEGGEPARAQQYRIGTGIHAMAMSPSCTRIVTGGESPNDLVVFDNPSLAPVRILEGSEGWVFGAVWLNNRHVAAASRDGGVLVWDTEAGPGDGASASAETDVEYEHGYTYVRESLRRDEHTDKVRAIQFDGASVGTVDTGGTFKLWLPATMDVERSVLLRHTRDIASMAVSRHYGVYAVGSESHIQFIDPRVRRGVLYSAPSVDRGMGTRSLVFRDHLCTTGGGGGRLGVYDMRVGKFLHVHECRGSGWVQRGNASSLVNDLQSDFAGLGLGLGLQDQDQEGHVARVHQDRDRPALYCQAWGSANRLFVGGGPLQLGKAGAYFSIWS